jgi:hypothetical protein
VPAGIGFVEAEAPTLVTGLLYVFKMDSEYMRASGDIQLTPSELILIPLPSTIELAIKPEHSNVLVTNGCFSYVDSFKKGVSAILCKW